MNDYEDLWNGDLSKVDVVTDTVDIYDLAHPDGEVHGGDEFEEVIREIHEAFPDFEISKEAEEMLASDDAIMGPWSLTGTFEGSFYGIPPTGRTMELHGMSDIELVDGTIQADHIHFNEREMLEQFGYTIPDIIPLAPKVVWGKLSETL